MTIKITRATDIPFANLEEDMRRRIGAAGQIAGRVVARNLADEVKRRIPAGTGGWFQIYRSAIEFKETIDGSEWAVAGLSPVKLSDPPADQTLVFFSGLDEVGRLMRSYNPWVIDLIPPIAGGYTDSMIVQAATPARTSTDRARLANLLGVVKTTLTTLGVRMLGPGEFPAVQGRVLADIAFLARRLELGAKGFPKVAHWGPAISQAESRSKAWIAASADEIEAAIMSGSVPPGPTMSKAEAAALRRNRDTTWP